MIKNSSLKKKKNKRKIKEMSDLRKKLDLIITLEVFLLGPESLVLVVKELFLKISVKFE